jgi:hypothetical protein
MNDKIGYAGLCAASDSPLQSALARVLLDLFLKHLPDNKRRFLPNWNDEKPHRSSVRTPSGPDVAAIQTRVASGKSVGMSAYLLIQSNSGTQCLGAKRIAHLGCC